jgi:hypothetical protein
MLVRPQASFELARRVQIGDATLGEVFTFCSGLYFRGKLAYARRFENPPRGLAGVHIITPSRGLVVSEMAVGLAELAEFGAVDVDHGQPLYTGPLQATARALGGDCEVVLLGSIATGKYVEPLLPVLGERLVYPREFAGRGDMSRGALMLRRAASGEELDYLPVPNIVRVGRSPTARPAA